MTNSGATSDRLAAVLQQHGSPATATLIDDLTSTYLRIADMFGVNGSKMAASQRAAGSKLHGDLAALAAVSGDQISTREHLLTATRLAAGDTDLNAMTQVEKRLVAAPPADCAYAIYDLSRGTLTFDFLHYLMLAEQFRVRAGKGGLYVIFVRAPGDGYRRASNLDQFLPRDRKQWRFANLLVPCAQLVPSCKGVYICHDRNEAASLLRGLPGDSIFPQGFTIEAPSCPYTMPDVQKHAGGPRDIRALQAPPIAAALVRRWFAEIAGPKPVVAITLRQSDYQPARNSNFDAWRIFAAWAAEQGFHPVIVPDTEALLSGNTEPFDGVSVLPLPALSIGYRMAVYQESFVSMMVNNGPYGLCIYHPSARYLTFKMLNPSIPICTAKFLTAQGIPPDRQLPFAGPHQRLVWDMDDAAPLQRAFTALVDDVLAVPAPQREAAAG